jgi:hypothetical protein
MKNRRTALILAVVSIALGVLFRFQFVDRLDFNSEDLAYYERTSYGIDLPDHYGDTPYWLAWSRGDGQAYVTLAGDPWAEGPVRGLGVALYRYSRIGYSWAGLGFAFGQVDLIPYGLFAVSLLSLGAIGWIVGRNLRRWGPRSLILLVVPGALISAASDTAEAFGLALATIAVTAPIRSGVAAALVMGVVRPDFATTLFLRGRRSVWLVGACAASAIGIRLLGMSLGLKYAGLNNNLTWPLIGYLDVFGTQPVVDRAVTAGLLAVAIITVFQAVRHEQGWRRLAFLSTGLFVLLLAPLVLDNSQNSLRAAAGLSLIWAMPPGNTGEPVASPSAEREVVESDSGTPGL